MLNKSIIQDPVIIFQGITLSQFQDMLTDAVIAAQEKAKAKPFADLPDIIYNRHDVARILGVKYPTVQRRIEAQPSLRHYDSEGKAYYVKSELIEFMQSKLLKK